MIEFFSEREKGKKELTSEEISVSVFNGIVGVYKSFQKNLSYHFPERCPDNNRIFDVDESLLNAAINSYIPDMETPVNVKWNEDNKDIIDESEKYALLDFIEFCFSKIKDIEENDHDFHGFFGHYHLSFPDTENANEKFRLDVNRIFERNGIVFYLDAEGMIKRHLPSDMNNLLENLIIKSSDDRLNELINLAIDNIRKPKEANRIIALEKVWDAFERMKTVYLPANKKQSAITLITNVAGQTSNFHQLLNDEFTALTKIGNDYQIRHFETNKIQIKSMKQVDYLFYRMIALIDLCLDDLNIK
ncbi:AbiJ-NTD4 domain-containing protein [Cytobacillus firmus]|uniref:AbiJ-NTD4 domain-containing protein n=1 Tax=Cytobacillus firmus TaxID=1399 RepID=UPI0036C1C4F6